MNVVRHAAGGDQRESLAFGDAVKIVMKICDTTGGDERTPFLGAENTMDEVARIRVCHLHRPLGDSDSITPPPPH